MTCVDILPGVDTLMDRQKLVGWIVRDSIINSGMSFSEASRRWPIALPTLNRLMRTGDVSIRFYRQAELNLGLPKGLLEMVVDGDAARISGLPGLDPSLRSLILSGLGADQPRPTRRRRAT